MNWEEIREEARNRKKSIFLLEVADIRTQVLEAIAEAVETYDDEVPSEWVDCEQTITRTYPDTVYDEVTYQIMSEYGIEISFEFRSRYPLSFRKSTI